jgi:hypothetical protein
LKQKRLFYSKFIFEHSKHPDDDNNEAQPSARTPKSIRPKSPSLKSFPSNHSMKDKVNGQNLVSHDNKRSLSTKIPSSISLPLPDNQDTKPLRNKSFKSEKIEIETKNLKEIMEIVLAEGARHVVDDRR